MRFRAAALIAAAGFLVACYTPGGGWYPSTGGATTFFSYETRPASIKIIDLRDGSTVFNMDVPAGKQLTIDFVPDRGDDPELRPDLMRYEVWPIGTTTGSLSNSITVPTATSRRLDVKYREDVEFAQAPVEEILRTDQPEDRPDFWSPEGGPVPADQSGRTTYDG